MPKPVKFSASKPKPRPATVNYAKAGDTSFDFGFNVINKDGTAKRKRKQKPGGGS